MAKPRIATKPAELRDQLTTAASGIQGEPNWPATAPTLNEVQTAYTQINNAITTLTNLENQVKTARADLHDKVAAGDDKMKKVDSVTDGLYGPDGTEKNNFGLPPKKSTAGPSVPLDQVVILKIGAGTASRSISLDWDPEEGAGAYQVEAYTDSALTQLVQSATVTSSEVTIQNLTQGQQYWFRVCAVRGDERGPWSDIATQVAGL